MDILNQEDFFNIFLFLPETNKNPHKTIHLKQTLKNYGSLFKNKIFISYLVPDTTIRAGMFAYIAGSSYVFINAYEFTQAQYSLLFALNGTGIVLSAQINRRLLNRFSSHQILSTSIYAAAIASVIVLIGGMFGSMALMLMAPLFLFIACLNFISPNSMALAMESQGHQAGTAAAFYGSAQWFFASIASAFVSHFHDSSALPMTATICGCGIASMIGYQLLQRGSNKKATV